MRRSCVCCAAVPVLRAERAVAGVSWPTTATRGAGSGVRGHEEVLLNTGLFCTGEEKNTNQ